MAVLAVDMERGLPLFHFTLAVQAFHGAKLLKTIGETIGVRFAILFWKRIYPYPRTPTPAAQPTPDNPGTAHQHSSVALGVR
jgi:hypothetical protein